MNKELKEIIINDFELFYMDNEEEFKNQDILKTISEYVSGLYYDLLDNLDLERQEFQIDKDLNDFDAVTEIEDIITKILMDNEFNN